MPATKASAPSIHQNGPQSGLHPGTPQLGPDTPTGPSQQGQAPVEGARRGTVGGAGASVLSLDRATGKIGVRAGVGAIWAPLALGVTSCNHQRVALQVYGGNAQTDQALAEFAGGTSVVGPCMGARISRAKLAQLYHDETTGKLELYPIDDGANVDARRLEIGKPPLADYDLVRGADHQSDPRSKDGSRRGDWS